MKVKLTTAALISLLSTGMISAAEVYNKDGNKLNLYAKIAGSHYFSNNSSINGDKTCVRFGFKSEIQVNDHLIGYGQWEHGFEEGNNEPNKSKTSLSFVGLRFNELSSLSYGKNYGIAHDVSVFTNILPEHNRNSWMKADNFMTGSTNGVVTYRNNNFFGLINGLNFAVQHQGKNDRSNVIMSNGNGWGLSSSYKFNNFNIAAAYAKANRTNINRQQCVAINNDEFNTSIDNDKSANIWVTGFKYDSNDIYLATTYTETRNITNFGKNSIAGKTQNFEAVARYQFDFGLRPSLGYLYSKGRNLGTYGDQDLVKYVELGTFYFFDKNMFTYIDYKINLLKDNTFTKIAGIKTDNVVSLGLIYQF